MKSITKIYSILLLLGILLILTGIYTNSITDDLFEYSFVLAAICLLNILNLSASLFGKSNKLDVVLNLAILITSFILIIPLGVMLRFISDFGTDDFYPAGLLFFYILALALLSGYHIGLPFSPSKSKSDET
jgi:uncharacterized membrane protein YoaK (UPF0700 family)